MLELDVDEMINHISRVTNIDREIVELVINTEEKYLIDKDIIVE